MDKTSYTEALDSVTWYNCLAESVLKWLEIKPENGKSIIPLKDYGAENTFDYYQLQVIWMIAINLFGDWGTSPRFGWINDIDGFHKWILDITELWRSSDDYNGPEEYRIKEEIT